MKRTTLILLVLFLLLGGASIWYLTTQQDKKTSYSSSASERDFAVEEVNRIHKIFLADRRGNTTTLERKDNYWLYNGKYRANNNVMNNLLATIGTVQIQYIPPQAAIPNMIKDLSSQGIKVELYDKQDELIKAYYVGGSTPDESGTYMIMEGSETPYITEIPTLTGGLRGRYGITGDNWRDKSVFWTPMEQIQSVSIEYPKQQNKSFIVQRTEDGYAVQPFYSFTPPINKPVNKGKVERFLSGFDRIVAEAFENDNPLRDSITQRIPFAEITLRTTGGQEKVVRLHPARSSNRIQQLEVIERYLAEVEPLDDFMLIQHNLIRNILWGYSFFYDEVNNDSVISRQTKKTQ